jgi:hypothetical protein
MRQRLIILAASAAVLFGVLTGCGLAPAGVDLEPHPADAGGLLLAEEIEINFMRDAFTGLVPRAGTVSEYSGRLEPGGRKIVFSRRGSGALFLARLPGDWPPPGSDPRVVLTGHEISGPTGSFTSGWPPGREISIPAARAPGRIVYLGLLRRRILLEPSGAARSDNGDGPAPAVEVSFHPDPEGKALGGALIDNPWLRKRLAGPAAED